MSKYIVHRRFKGKAMSKQVNLSVGTECISKDGIIYHENDGICAEDSQSAYDYFAINDDGNGLMRGNYTQFIRNLLSIKDNYFEQRQQLISEDATCQNYLDESNLWKSDFYKALISDLSYILDLIAIEDESDEEIIEPVEEIE